MKKYRDLVTVNPEIKVHVTEHEKDGLITLRGYAIRAKDGCRIDGSTTLKRVAHSAEEIPNTEQHLVAAVLAALPKNKTVRETTKCLNNDQVDEDNAMVIAFRTLMKNGGVVSPDWNEQVTHRWLTYYERKILGRIQQFTENEFSDADREDLRVALIKEVNKSGRSRGNMQTVARTLQTNLAASQMIYDAMRRIDPTLPDITIYISQKKKRVSPEQIKSLPDTVRSDFRKRLEEKALTEPDYTIGAVLMFDGGARTAEAAGVNPWADIDLTGVHGVYQIGFQEKDGTRCAILKSRNAYRMVPLSFWATTMINTCMDTMTGNADDAAALLSSRKLSRWVMEQLRECGCGSNFWQEAMELESKFPDVDDEGNIIYDITAYVLRRDRCSRWRNVCGLSREECDYLLGHKSTSPKELEPDYRLAEVQHEIMEKLERYVYSKVCTMNPAYNPLRLEANKDIDYSAFESLRFRNDEEVELQISFTLHAEEPGQAITIQTSNEVRILNTTVSEKNTKGKRENKPTF